MKRFAIIIVAIVMVLSLSTTALADSKSGSTLVEKFIQSLFTPEKGVKPRGYLVWGMTAEEVIEGLSNEMHGTEKACDNIKTLYSPVNATISYVKANTVLGDYKPTITCSVSSMWGLYSVKYDFFDASALAKDPEAQAAYSAYTDDDFLSIYETLEKTINYCYGMGERAIDKWFKRTELEEGYYAIKTTWSKEGTSIQLCIHKQSAGYMIDLEYRGPGANGYEKIIMQDLEVKDTEMFFGF